MMERLRKEMILMERGLHSPTAGKRLANLSDTTGNAVLEALENSSHSPRLAPSTLHGGVVGDIPSKGKFEIDALFNLQHPGGEGASDLPPSESRKKVGHYSEGAPEAEMNSDVEVGCSALRSPASLTSSQLKENNNKGNSISLSLHPPSTPPKKQNKTGARTWRRGEESRHSAESPTWAFHWTTHKRMRIRW